MPVRETEAIILRSYPLKEADKIVSFLSRAGGKTRGVAPNARRSVKRFGAGLELLSHVRLRYQEREAQDLVRLESCELLESFFDAQSSYDAAVAFGHVAEVAEQLLPEREANDAFFRLILLVIEEMRRTGEIWRPPEDVSSIPWRMVRTRRSSMRGWITTPWAVGRRRNWG